MRKSWARVRESVNCDRERVGIVIEMVGNEDRERENWDREGDE